jgi:nitrate reductase assembly molybdenum cofactor insertion protein NarJ
MSASGAAVDSRVYALLREAAEWRLLGRLFDCPDEPWRQDVAALARETDDDVLRRAAAAALDAATHGQYHSVFGPGGPAPPREASYQQTVELGSLMSELAAYYEAFHYRPATCEAPDHVAVEAGFVAYLRLKQAYAAAAGDAEHEATTAEAVDRFRSTHLAVIATPLAAALADSGVEYLVQASRLLVKRAGHRPQSARLHVLHDPGENDESRFACGEP